MTDDHPVDAALRKLVGDHQPTARDRRLAAQRLEEAIKAESSPARPPGWARRFVLIAALAAVAFGFIYLLRPTHLEAATEEIAKVAETVDPLTLPANTYLYTRAEVVTLGLVSADALGDVDFNHSQLVYLLPSIRETWIAADGTIHINTANQQPTFFTEEAEAAYYAGGLDDTDNIGETVSETFEPASPSESWPAEVDALEEAIRSTMADQGLPDTVEVLDVALDIIRENLIDPSLRANTIRLIGKLDGLEVRNGGEKRATFAIDYTDRGLRTTFSFTLDQSGNLTAEETTLTEPDSELGVPAGTVIARARYTDRQVVNDLNAD